MPVVLLGVFAALCWSVHDLFARSLAMRIGPFRMAVLVMIAGGLLLTGFVISSGTVWSASWTALWPAVGLGIAYGFGAAGLFKAFSLGPISLVAPLSATYPVLVVAWGFLGGLEPTLMQWAGTAAALGGAAIVARSGAEGGIGAIETGKLPALMFFCVLSGVGYAAAVILGQNAAVTVGEIEATWISRPIALLSILPFMVNERTPLPLWPRHWLGVTVMAALDVLAVIAINASGHLSGKEFAAIGISAYGAMAVMLAMIFLKEKVSWGQWVGVLMITGGVATLSVSQ